ncbi:YheC/YheD family protein [Bacillus sp. FJAT-29790]|uniref:YheC/YheD family endospore coat-associated protein n=1 Tax=Bacillus sp. FJAT-29790 TaxID=1895002 RepID=UPI001C24ECD9|nr:YheC/YheD family protein [Bacillus sp. FJAT-29790]MBU8879961.1 YheC/YheD family protein [Bacillus sp. FJAT-29790]
MSNSNIGILVDGLIYSGIEYGHSYFERISFYEEACEQYGLVPCFFRLSDINFESKQVMAFVKEANGDYVKREFAIPSIIHNRGLFFTMGAKEKIKNLQEAGIVVFNERNRYGKMKVYETLIQNEDLKPHLPETVKASKENFQKMLEKHDQLIIKPNSGSLGSGIIKVERLEGQSWAVSYNEKKGEPSIQIPFTNEWPDLLKRKISNSYYIIQQRIPLATYEGSPFDMRVSVQKNGLGEWQVTGIVGKVAKSGGFVTNVAKGGECKSLQELLKDLQELDFNIVYKNIEDFSIKAVKELAEHFPHLADVGFDIGITEDGFPMFIECNGRDLRITFGRANMLDVWKATYATPMSYASHLLKSKIEQG